jgi:hypothetical protein
VSDTTTPNLGLPYIDPNQAQPEVKINEAWDLIDAFAGETGHGGGAIQVEEEGDSPPVSATKLKFIGATVTGESGEVAVIEIEGGSLEVSEVGDSPAGDKYQVTHIKFAGATVTPETDGSVLVETASGLAVEDSIDSPATTVLDVSVLRFEGAQVFEESGGVALVKIPSIRNIGAQWVNFAGSALALPTNEVLAVAADAGIIEEARIYTLGGSGGCTIDIWKCPAGAVPTSSNDITAGGAPAISAGTSYDNTTLSGWTKDVAVGDVFLFTLAAVSSFTSVFITLKVKPA